MWWGYPGLSWVSGSDEKGQDSAGLALSFLPAGFLPLSTQPLPFRSQNRHWALGTQEFSLESAKDWPPSKAITVPALRPLESRGRGGGWGFQSRADKEEGGKAPVSFWRVWGELRLGRPRRARSASYGGSRGVSAQNLCCLSGRC